MSERIVLASASAARQSMLRNAQIKFESVSPRIDEDSVQAALLAEEAAPRDIADALAEMKARKVGDKHLDAFVIGCDQVLDFEGRLIGKPETQDVLRTRLQEMRGKRHQLLSAVVIFNGGEPVWRHIGIVRMTMHSLSDAYIESYIARNWQDVRHAAGGYMLEGEGVRLFSSVSGDYFTVLGLPLVELLSYLRLRGLIDQ